MNRNIRSSPADRFVDAVYRRWVIVHFFEQIGRGLLAGSLLALVLMLAAIWQAIPTVPILIFAVASGLFPGLILVFYRRPNRNTAAIEADRQLHLDDLLTSALFASDRADPDFRAIIQQMADARCIAHSPSEVILRRFGIRSWSGIALAMCIAVTLAVIPLQPSQSQAVDANASVLSANPSGPAAASLTDRGMLSVFNNPQSDGARNGSMSTEQPTADSNDRSNSTEHSETKSQGKSAGIGGDAASSHAEPTPAPPTGQSAGRSSAQTGATAGNGAASDHHNSIGEASDSAMGTAAKPNQPVPAWSGESSNSQNPGSEAADRTPPEDRDLIRDFFQR